MRTWKFRCKPQTHSSTKTAKPTNGLSETSSTALTSLSDDKLLLIHLCLIFTLLTTPDSEKPPKPGSDKLSNRSLLLLIKQHSSRIYFHSYQVKEMCRRRIQGTRLSSKCGSLHSVRDSNFARPSFSFV